MRPADARALPCRPRTTPRADSEPPHSRTRPLSPRSHRPTPALRSTGKPAPRSRPPTRSSAVRPLTQWRTHARTPTQCRASPMAPLPPRIPSSTCAHWYPTSAPPAQPCQAPSSRAARPPACVAHAPSPNQPASPTRGRLRSDVRGNARAANYRSRSRAARPALATRPARNVHQLHPSARARAPAQIV
ncbi:hypothetical protein FIBSPDRAFT_1052004 [Athelia psychrophila]|uniref:Uncharacterized protein n=1 Tax=Athelia psychrophila TaxID=1759441 RepID=A0A165Y1M9_9AGAM|nr:hypothetical protein FIBSPDRAFT_1052004 [Fibularhizoctonia sp. CBS 109695]